MTENQLQQTPAQPSTAIDGVYFMPLKAFGDERGRFMETFRREWFPWIDWERTQGNRSDSKAGVLRGLHYHFYQIDYWCVINGLIRVGLCDLRKSSPTYMATQTIDVGEGNGIVNNVGVFIPVGVAHGFYAITDATLTYLVNNYYDGDDERGVAWNDPDISLDWGVESPILSPRDVQNRRLADIPLTELPK